MAIRIPNEDENRVLLSEGPHLFQITAASIGRRNDKEVLRLRTRVLQGPTPAGTAAIEELHLTPDAIKRVGILAKRLGLIDRGKDDLEIDLDEQAFVGKQVVAVIAHEQFQNKKGEMVTVSKWDGFASFWAPDDPRSPMTPNTFAAPGTRPASPVQQPVTTAATDWSNV